MELETMYAVVALVVGFTVGWCLRELYLRQKDYTNLGLLSVALSAYAASETRALKQAPILRQYIERYLPQDGKATEKEMQDKMAAMSKEFEEMFSPTKTAATPNGLKPTVHTNGKLPEDLV